MTSDPVQEVFDDFILVVSVDVDAMAPDGSDQLHLLLQQEAESHLPLSSSQACIYLLLFLFSPLCNTNTGNISDSSSQLVSWSC